MKMKFTQTLAAVLMVSAALLTSCKPNDKPDNKISAETKEVKYLDATAYGKWVYFSLKDNKVVMTTSPEKDMSWDIAFRRECIAVNAPAHYSGKGGIVRTGEMSFDAALKTAGLKFVQNSPKILAITSPKAEGGNKTATMYVAQDLVKKMVKRGDKEVEESINRIACYDLDVSKTMQGASAVYQPVKDVYVVCAADGKTLYGLQFTGAVNAQGKNGGTLSFRYREIR